ncbi:MAG: DUF1894 domain-containing protein [Methanomicrobiales archaeon]|nr:DUF1894 domain-containing protein [Methanomicrobiales archaeon]
MGCVEARRCEVLASQVTFAECREYITTNFPEHYEVEPGFHLFDVYIIGVPPVYVGIEGEDVIFPYTKPCHGTFILRAKGAGEEAVRLRALKTDKTKTKKR